MDKCIMLQLRCQRIGRLAYKKYVVTSYSIKTVMKAKAECVRLISGSIDYC